MRKITTITVDAYVPEGTLRGDLVEFVKDALSSWGGQFHPDEPLFNSLDVQHVRTKSRRRDFNPKKDTSCMNISKIERRFTETPGFQVLDDRGVRFFIPDKGPGKQEVRSTKSDAEKSWRTIPAERTNKLRIATIAFKRKSKPKIREVKRFKNAA